MPEDRRTFWALINEQGCTVGSLDNGFYHFHRAHQAFTEFCEGDHALMAKRYNAGWTVRLEAHADHAWACLRGDCEHRT